MEVKMIPKKVKKVPSEQGRNAWPKVGRSRARRNAARVRAQGEKAR